MGAALAAATFAVTSTFLITGPAFEPSLGGFPALSAANAFLVKDLMLLGVAVAALGDTLSSLDRLDHRRTLATEEPAAGHIDVS